MGDLLEKYSVAHIMSWGLAEKQQKSKTELMLFWGFLAFLCQ
jgi:hypothetical protein